MISVILRKIYVINFDPQKVDVWTKIFTTTDFFFSFFLEKSYSIYLKPWKLKGKLQKIVFEL